MTVGAFSFFASLLVWIAIDKVLGLRVSPEHELVGLDLAELGMEAYPAGGQLDAIEEPANATIIAATDADLGRLSADPPLPADGHGATAVCSPFNVGVTRAIVPSLLKDMRSMQVSR